MNQRNPTATNLLISLLFKTLLADKLITLLDWCSIMCNQTLEYIAAAFQKQLHLTKFQRSHQSITGHNILFSCNKHCEQLFCGTKCFRQQATCLLRGITHKKTDVSPTIMKLMIYLVKIRNSNWEPLIQRRVAFLSYIRKSARESLEHPSNRFLHSLLSNKLEH